MDGFSLQRLSVCCKRDAGTGFRILGVQGQSLGKPPGPSPLLYHQASEAQQSELTQAVLLLLKMHGYLLYTKVPLWHFKIRDLESEHCCASCLTPVFPNIFQQNKHLFTTLFNCISVKYLIKKKTLHASHVYNILPLMMTVDHGEEEHILDPLCLGWSAGLWTVVSRWSLVSEKVSCRGHSTTCMWSPNSNLRELDTGAWSSLCLSHLLKSREEQFYRFPTSPYPRAQDFPMVQSPLYSSLLFVLG